MDKKAPATKAYQANLLTLEPKKKMNNQGTTPIDTNTLPNKVKNRNPWLAGVLAFFAYGLGHLYVGKFQRAVVILAVYGVLMAIIILTRLQHYYAGTLIFVLLSFSVTIFTVVDAARLAIKQKPYVMKSYNRWYYYIGFLVLASSINYFISENRDDVFGFKSYRIPSTSMAPTVRVGDFIIVDTWAYNNNSVERGDIIVFKYPNDPSIDYIFRVIALPGEEFEYTNKQIYLDGKPMQQYEKGSYTSLAKPDRKFTQKIEILEGLEYKILLMERHPTINTTMIVPEDHYLVMGDNRDNANDSRYWGYVPVEYIKGKALYVWFNYSEAGGFATERFGQVLQ
jgi:signal peptidase I